MYVHEKLIHEFSNLEYNPLTDLGYSIELFNKCDIFKWRITLIGAKDSPYEDGIFFLELLFPQDYPRNPPRISFLTPIYHPNVHAGDGFVCVNFTVHDWKATTSVREILTKLYSIFYIVNPDSPYSREQAIEYKENRELYYSKARYFTLKYANIKSFENFKKPDIWNWSFSFNINDLNKLERKKMKIYIDANGTQEFSMDFFSDELAKDMIEKFNLKYQITKDMFSILCIYKRTKIKIEKTLAENGLEDQSHIILISDVHY